MVIFAALAMTVSTAVVLGAQIPIDDCGSEAGYVTAIDVYPCQECPCTFKRNSTVYLSFTFISDYNIDDPKINIFHLHDGTRTPLDNVESDLCKHVHCPVEAGESATYSNDFFVDPSYAALKYNFQVEIISRSALVVCFLGDIRITN